MRKGYNSKTCIKCKKEQPLDGFRYTDAAHKSRRNDCKNCEKEYKQSQEYKDKESRRVKQKRSKDPLYRQKQMTDNEFALFCKRVINHVK